jgi:dihydropteroate synthase
MGILNVTPDSFSDGGDHADPDTAIRNGLAMAEAGADIVDIGGESTRPGATPVPPDVEIARVVPVIRALADQGVRISIDTRNATTMEAALDAGAAIVNDVSGLAFDSKATNVVSERRCPVILMHMRGTPQTMVSLARYTDVVKEVARELTDRAAAAVAASIAPGQIALDPGIGFAKTAEQSVELLRRLDAFVALGYPIVIGVSRKSFIGRLSGEPDAGRRLGGSLAAALHALAHGAAILRVHDVPETVQAVRVWRELSATNM